jgi:negative regulator of sigma E activity
VTIDDETLMAYADGELEAAERARIVAALEKDPELAARVEKHRALRAQVAGAFAPLLDEPVPDRLRAAARGGAVAESGRDTVIEFPTRRAGAAQAPWRAREWFAMAASLLLGVAVSWRAFSPRDAATLSADGGSLVARGVLAAALDAQLAGNAADESPVGIGLTFKARDGSYCRSFTLRTGGVAGLACRAGDEWHVPVTASADAAGGDFRQAASAIPPAVMQAIEARIAGDALDASEETRARDAGWKTR